MSARWWFGAKKPTDEMLGMKKKNTHGIFKLWDTKSKLW